ncbi:hypothetical protein Salat_2295500 [Sesamum alatum]|uniref:Uncharacterized protein n=1 Tax=Sesamum alatum TaxID=300844 RepID=A0AAE1XWF7_9LAMI|nr:hypothetical protein Salat_2295500 [Sesamum alatum]
MVAAQSPYSGGHQLIQGPKSGRRPLQPMNQISTTPITAKPKTNPAEISGKLDNCNKENVPPINYNNNNNNNYSSSPVKKEYFPFDASLADELTAIREKLERLRIDKEKTEKMLRERGLMLDLQMKEIIDRGEAQKHLEIEVDRLYRLKEIKLAACMRISPLRSLRDKEEEKKMKQDHHDNNQGDVENNKSEEREKEEHKDERAADINADVNPSHQVVLSS